MQVKSASMLQKTGRPANGRDKAGHSVTKGKEKKVSADYKEKERKCKEENLEEKKSLAMRNVNNDLKTLSGLVLAKWSPTNTSVFIASKGGGNKTYTRHTVFELVENAKEALNTLRNLKHGVVDVERAAGSLVGKAMALALVRSSMEYQPLKRLTADQG